MGRAAFQKYHTFGPSGCSLIMCCYSRLSHDDINNSHVVVCIPMFRSHGNLCQILLIRKSPLIPFAVCLCWRRWVGPTSHVSFLGPGASVKFILGYYHSNVLLIVFVHLEMVTSITFQHDRSSAYSLHHRNIDTILRVSCSLFMHT